LDHALAAPSLTGPAAEVAGTKTAMLKGASEMSASVKPVDGRNSMYSDSQRLKRVFGGLLLVSAVTCFATAGCSDIQPEPNVEEGGLLESPTHEQDSMREQEENR
jgi:hypothetical protein